MKPRDNERLDQWMDGALTQYGAAEPRPGLEGRVLANLRAGPQPVGVPANWWPLLIGITAMLMMGAGLFFAIGHLVPKKDRARLTAAPINQPHSSPTLAHNPSPSPVAFIQVQRKYAGRARPVRFVEAADPRLAQFPAPRPLSEQEKMLLRYVEERPREAEFVVRARAASLQQDLLEFQKQSERRGLPESSSPWSQ